MTFRRTGCEPRPWFLSVLVVVLLLAEGTRAAFRPNIIIIVADDMGWNDVSFHGSDEIPTPNIDALAYNGVILNQHYVQPVCSPSRAALMSGMYPIHTGMQGYPILAAEPRALPLRTILPEYLQQLGYFTAGIGKWHLGSHRTQFLPTRRGFDSFLGYYGGFISYYDHILEANIPDYGYVAGHDLRRNESIAWDLQGKYATDIFTEEAINVIRRHDTRGAPLFMFLSHLGVHSGNAGKLLEAPQEEVDKFRHITDPNRRTYAAMVSKLDQSVGRVTAALQARGMLDNSIILFMSDNGAPTEAVMYQNWGSNSPLRGVKDTLWEGGVRSNAVIWSPTIHRRARVSHELMHITDWLPTLYTAAGGSPVDLPPDLDGVDQWATITSDLPSRRSEILLNIDERRRTAALRQNNWKLTIGTVTEGKYDGYFGSAGSPTDPSYNYSGVSSSLAGRALATHGARVGWPATREFTMASLRARATVRCPPRYNPDSCDPTDTSRPCLYDISNDPCETNNLADLYPTLVRSLKRKLVAYRSTLVRQPDTPLQGAAADPRRFGNAWAPWQDGSLPSAYSEPPAAANDDETKKAPETSSAPENAADAADENAPSSTDSTSDSSDKDQ